MASSLPEEPLDLRDLRRYPSLGTNKPHHRMSKKAEALPGSELLLRMSLESNPESLCLVRATLQRAAEVALLMATLPPHMNMLEAIVLPVKQAYLGRG